MNQLIGRLPRIKQLQAKAVSIIGQAYLQYRMPVCIGYSGGKDSTVTLDLALRAVMALDPSQRTQTVYVIYSDVLVEMHPVISVIDEQIRRFEDYVRRHDLPFVFKRAVPEVRHRFWSLTIGRGYMLPRQDLRICTDRMKLKPQQKMMLETFTPDARTTGSLFEADLDSVELYSEENDRQIKMAVNELKYLGIIGVRKEESADRKERIEKHAVAGAENLMKVDGRLTVTPVSDWTSDEIWQYIYTEALPWVDAAALGQIYAQSSGQADNECNSIVHGQDAADKAGCSMSGRFGCSVCSLQGVADKALQNLTRHYPYMQPIKAFRDWIVSTYTFSSWDNRDLYNHREFKRLDYRLDTNHRSGMTMPGGYTLEVRKLMLDRLLEAESLVQAHQGMEGYRLITDEELHYISRVWFDEGDLAFSAAALAEKYGRHAIKDPQQVEMAVSIKAFMALLPLGTKAHALHTNGFAPDSASAHTMFDWIPKGLYASPHFERFAVQLALQLKERFDARWEEHYFSLAFPGHQGYDRAVGIFHTLPVSEMYFPSQREEYALREEHREDKIDYLNFVTQMHRDMTADQQKHGLFFEFEGSRRTAEEWFASKSRAFRDLYADYYEAYALQESGDVPDDDWLNNPLIPMEHKYKILDGWY